MAEVCTNLGVKQQGECKEEPSNASLFILVLLGNIEVNLGTGSDRTSLKTLQQ